MRILKRDREILRAMKFEYIDLRYDYARRLRNALLCLAQSDPDWMIWVEREIKPRWSLQRITRLVEARARTLVLKQYSFFHRQNISDLIFRDGWFFTDRGSLSPG
jgi:hypothetical protein